MRNLDWLRFSTEMLDIQKEPNKYRSNELIGINLCFK